MRTVSNRESFLFEVGKFIPIGSACCELGVLHGDFSQSILKILNPEVLILVDPFSVSENKYNDGLTTSYSTEHDYVDLLKRFQQQIYSKQVIVNRKYSFYAVNQYSDSIFNFIYIDASHLYEDVKRDLNDWLPKLKSGGILAGHDYITLNDFGVIQSVDEFCIENNFEMILFNKNGGDWALKQK